MAEVCRQENRENLRQATQIALAMDESKYRKIIRFRCDRPNNHADGSLWRRRTVCSGGFALAGVLG